MQKVVTRNALRTFLTIKTPCTRHPLAEGRSATASVPSFIGTLCATTAVAMQWRRRRSVLLNVVATAAELTVGRVILHALAVFDFDVKLGTFQHVENNVEPDLDIALALSAGVQEPLDLPPGRSSVPTF